MCLLLLLPRFPVVLYKRSDLRELRHFINVLLRPLKAIKKLNGFLKLNVSMPVFVFHFPIILHHKYLIRCFLFHHAVLLLPKHNEILIKKFFQLGTFEREKDFLKFIFWEGIKERSEAKWKLFQTEFIMCDAHDLSWVPCWKMRVFKRNLTAWQDRIECIMKSFVLEIYCV